MARERRPLLTDDRVNALILVAFVVAGAPIYLAHRAWTWARTGRWVYP